MFEASGASSQAVVPRYPTELERAFDMPLDGLVRTLASYAFHRCAGDRAEAEDLVQEAVRRLVQKANGGWRCPADNRSGYLFALIRNLRVEEVRSRRWVVVGPVDPDRAFDPVPGPEEHVIGRIDAEQRQRDGERLIGLLGQLRKPEHREV